MIMFLDGVNWVDYLFLGLLVYFVLTNAGFIGSLAEIVGLLFATIVAFKFYAPFFPYVENTFHLTEGISKALAFIGLWVVVEIIFFTVIHLLLKKIPPSIYHSKLNYILGIVPGIGQACIFFAFIVTSLVALPVRGTLKNSVLTSRTAPFFLQIAQQFEISEKSIFKDAISESLNFVTIQSESEKSINLGFTVSQSDLKINVQEEKSMVALINEERASRGIAPLTLNRDLTIAARGYGEEMFMYGFFSHNSLVDNTSPADRLNNDHIPYTVMGENLAYAPDVQIAHTGLMNSPGHRANILSPEFHQVGIGIISGGIYEEMFVQEFTN